MVRWPSGVTRMKQRAVAGLIQQQFPAAAVHQRYQIVFNGIGLALPNASAATLANIAPLKPASACSAPISTG
ncbi:MAG: hypothetical protein HC829_07010 [Bacteroidales bacterium]|nr:hypothetical protein [Bacteroidales bacterium]